MQKISQAVSVQGTECSSVGRDEHTKSWSSGREVKIFSTDCVTEILRAALPAPLLLAGRGESCAG